MKRIITPNAVKLILPTLKLEERLKVIIPNLLVVKMFILLKSKVIL